jgi:hypothetical protein
LGDTELIFIATTVTAFGQILKLLPKGDKGVLKILFQRLHCQNASLKQQKFYIIGGLLKLFVQK